MLASLDLDNEVCISPVAENRNPWSEKQSVQRKCYENLLAILAENNNVLTEKLQTKDLPTCTFRASFIKDLKDYYTIYYSNFGLKECLLSFCF